MVTSRASTPTPQLCGLVVRVRVSFSRDWSDIVPQLGPRDGDIVITKRQWGAFYGTDLDLQLRRRGVNAIVLCGIATNFGVESTARSGAELRFDVVLLEDVMTSMTADAHRFAVQMIFPRLGRVRTADQIRFAR